MLVKFTLKLFRFVLLSIVVSAACVYLYTISISSTEFRYCSEYKVTLEKKTVSEIVFSNGSVTVHNTFAYVANTAHYAYTFIHQQMADFVWS